MGVICRASQSPVGEEGEGKGGRQGLLLIYLEYFNSLGVAVSLQQQFKLARCVLVCSLC